MKAAVPRTSHSGSSPQLHQALEQLPMTSHRPYSTWLRSCQRRASSPRDDPDVGDAWGHDGRSDRQDFADPRQPLIDAKRRLGAGHDEDMPLVHLRDFQKLGGDIVVSGISDHRLDTLNDRFSVRRNQ